MASHLSSHLQERRAARVRGAGGRKVENAGFSIQLPPAAPAPAAPAPAPSPPPTEPPQPAARSSPRPTGLNNRAVHALPSQPEHPPISSTPSAVDTPTRSTIVTVTVPAVSKTTPIPRGKRTRQKSPDKFLTEEEVREVEEAVVRRGRRQQRIVAEATPENSRKKRKVVVRQEEEEEQEVGVEAVEAEPELGPTDEQQPEPSIQRLPSRRTSRGKKPAPPVITSDDEREAQEEEQANTGLDEQPDEASEVGEELSPPPEPEDLPDDDSEDEYRREPTPPRTKGPFKASPKPKKKHAKPDRGAVRKKSKPAGSERMEQESHMPSGQGIPITVYRLANTTTSDLPLPKQRPGANAVDLVATMVMQQIDKYLAKQESQVVRKAIQRYRQEVEVRLMELNDRLEDNIVITGRLQKTKREVQALQRELLAIQEERRVVAAETDDVREQHDMGMRDTKIRSRDAETSEEIASLIERGRAHGDEDNDEMTGLEALAIEVSEVLGMTGTENGRHAQVKEFNRFLRIAEEKLVAVNSRRKSQKTGP